MGTEEIIILYTIGCPQCKVLEEKLNKEKINYVVIKDENYMEEKGITTVPMLEISGKRLNFSQAIKWLKER